MLKQIVLLVAIAAVAQSKSMNSITKKAEQNLASILLRSSSSIEKSPAGSISCFQTYTPILNQLTTEFEGNYTECVRTSEVAQSSLEAEVKANRQKIEYGGTNVCHQYTLCSSLSNSVDFFDCYAKAGSQSAKLSYQVEKDAKEHTQYTQFKSEEIVYEKNRCIDEATNTYEKKSSETYDNLNACLART